MKTTIKQARREDSSVVVWIIGFALANGAMASLYWWNF